MADKNISKEQLSKFRLKRKEEFESFQLAAKDEFDNESVSIGARKKFFELVKVEDSYGNTPQKEDLDMLGMSIVFNDELLTKSNLKFILMQYIKQGYYIEANKLINKLLLLYSETEYGQSLKKFSESVNQKLISRYKTDPKESNTGSGR